MTTPAKPRSWRDVLPVHPAADLFPLMPPAELKALGEDIKRHGQISAVVLCADGRLLDGRNRLDAMEAVGLPVITAEGKFAGTIHVTRRAENEDAYEFALSANVHRRHLTNEQKREVIAKVIAVRPNISNRRLGKLAKVDHKTVGAVRERLEARGEIPTSTVRQDTKGRQQPARKPPPPPAVKAAADRAEASAMSNKDRHLAARRAEEAGERAAARARPWHRVRDAWLELEAPDRHQFLQWLSKRRDGAPPDVHAIPAAELEKALTPIIGILRTEGTKNAATRSIATVAEMAIKLERALNDWRYGANVTADLPRPDTDDLDVPEHIKRGLRPTAPVV